MSNRRIFITGVGRGLGRELAARFVEAGHRVYGSTNNTSCDLELEGEIKLDLADEASIVRAVSELASMTRGIDALINCAGVDARAFGGAENHRGVFDADAAMFNAVINVNVTGPMVLTKEVLPLLTNGESPMIVNISSQLGSMQVAARKGRDAIYCVSKAALNMLSVKTAAALQPHRIGVVMMHPGWVQTDMGGPNAQLTLAEAADAILATIDSLSFADTGRFIRWDGHDHPW